ncbi:response regulator [Larkinella arboricola]|uniref:Response regulator receiver domain-containing protein n=1 Tax=Larkinella arboricola TaxID=643671 RepID=A0A327WTN2_LARAB|nr:response regulator [Larkinella arboricola]RAJ95988.1 response regulator receiver domain-containing protein [Larkinella arboricola]
MMSKQLTISILIADDDADDRMLIEQAFRENNLTATLNFVEDGEELIDFLLQREPYTSVIRPSLIILDLNMPRKNGIQALREIKANEQLRQIPIVVLTTSTAEEDILRTYDLGVSSYISKPFDYSTLLDITNTIKKYWIDTVSLPDDSTR